MNKVITGKDKAGLKIVMLSILITIVFYGIKLGFRDFDEPVSVGQSLLLLKSGRTMGVLAVILLIIGPVFSLKNKFLDQTFSLDRMFWIHKIIAILSLVLASLHPMVIYLSRIETAGPTSWEQWPEFLGAVGLFSLWLLVCSSVYRKFLLLEYEDWRKIHLLSAFLRYAAVIHVFAIESEARKGFYASFLIVLLIITLGLALWDKVFAPILRKKEREFKLLATRELAPEVFELRFESVSKEAGFNFFPGQFAYLKLKSAEFAYESHPFTIANSATISEQVTFCVKSIGDWSARLKKLPENLEAEIIGPFGQFSPFLFNERTERLILIAGGIGITPFISLLAFLSEKQIEVPVLLLWSNKSAKDFFNISEFSDAANKLPDFAYKLFVTRDKASDICLEKRINKETLKEFVPTYQAGTQVMVCGPGIMMENVRRDLIELGFPKKAIHYENFSYLE